MHNVLLINPPVHFADGVPHTLDTENPPLGLMYIAAYIQQQAPHFRVRVVDVGAEGTRLDAIERLVADLRPIAVGIPAMTLQLQGAVRVAQAVRRQGDARVIIGGNHVSGDPGFVRRNRDLFDHAITGEGEKTFLDTVVRIAEGRDVAEVQRGEIFADLDELPFPDRAAIARGCYARPDYFVVSRGCPFQCTFCATPALAAKVRFRSAESIIEEIRQSYHLSRGYISFLDDTFTAKRQMVIDLCARVRAARLKLQWRCFTRIDLVDDELLAAMRGAGCEEISFGIESGSERVRRESMGKGKFSNDEIRESIRLCRKHRIKANGFFIVGNPGETMAEIDETRDFALTSGLSGIAVSMLTPFPGSPLYDAAKNEGLIDETLIDRFARGELGAGATGVYPLYTGGLDREAVAKAMRHMLLRFYLRPATFQNFFLRHLRRPKELYQDFRGAFHLLTKGGSSRRPFT